MIRGIVFRGLKTARYGKGPGAIVNHIFVSNGPSRRKNTTNASNNILFSFIKIFRPS